MSDRKGVDPLFPPIERTSWDFIDWSGSPTLKQARQEAEKAAAEITRLRAALAEAERERDGLRGAHIAAGVERDRAERAEADLAAAREVIGQIDDALRINKPRGQSRALKIARAFLERTATAATGGD